MISKMGRTCSLCVPAQHIFQRHKKAYCNKRTLNSLLTWTLRELHSKKFPALSIHLRIWAGRRFYYEALLSDTWHVRLLSIQLFVCKNSLMNFWDLKVCLLAIIFQCYTRLALVFTTYLAQETLRCYVACRMMSTPRGKGKITSNERQILN